ncbi:hypothetical protein FY134_23835 (plasmid) [Agrobacterium fabrum]|uniref:hypothetical protein n=1 Tax=Agrobacterium fabrum TaxID=1176649 RepID=UPI000DD0229D|nr:hypothetical protein [Agrobacterium fabrum]UXT60727.1 hypothetical protein FY134_23835 [Agrobacterium fabrum]
MPNILVFAKSPGCRAGLIIPGAIMMILVAISALPFLNGTVAKLLEIFALAIGIPAGLFHVLGIMPPSLAREEIEWKGQHPDEYGHEEWEAVPFLGDLLVRVRAVEDQF